MGMMQQHRSGIDQSAGETRVDLDEIEVVLVSYRSRAHVEQLVQMWPGLAVVIVDNASGADGLAQFAADQPLVRYLDGGGQGFARAANLGAFSSTKRFVVFVNPDSRPTVDDLRALVDGLAVDPLSASHAATVTSADEDVEIGVGGWEPDVLRTSAYAVGLHKKWPKIGVYAKPAIGERLDVDWTTGACMAVRTEQFRRLGGFDESFFVYSEDMSFGRRVRQAGLGQRLRHDVVVRHGAGSSGAPSLEMMRMKGASFSNYVNRYHPGPQAKAMQSILAGGYLLRSGVQIGKSDRDLAAQYLAQAKGLLTGRAFVAGEEVAARRMRETAQTANASVQGSAAERPYLLITKEFGVPATSGGMLRTLAIARWLAGRAPVVVVSPRGVTGLRTVQGEVVIEQLRQAPSRSLVADAFTLPTYRCLGAPRTCGSALITGLRETLAQLGPFQAAVVDHTCLFGVADSLPPQLPVILSTHNVESDLMRQRAGAESGPTKVAAHLESSLLRRLERGPGTSYPSVVCTQADADRVRRDGGAEVVVARNGVTPPSGSQRAVALAQNPRTELLFTGALDWRPNINGITWLIESQAWRDLVAERPEIVLTVAGRNPSAEFRARLEAAPGVRLEADVPSMQPLLERARLGIAPLLEGGGSRIKLLEYIAHGLPSVSTVVGASGLDNLPRGAIVQTPEDAQAFCAAIRKELAGGPLVIPAEQVAAMLSIYGWDSALGTVAEVLPA
ncbi:glycosyltransferase [Gephyromycinifex aptenodytis]|uniref:glycosyltransferase n=1 Tax=Gephyromycinifex aptenodytis TaxID=2716227 RepID=UPI001D032309|nr:glycosyltransferase [Gephyromycinifex aptenodytis]